MKQLPAGEFTPNNLVYLEDKVRVYQGRPQLYGTQFDDQENFRPKHIEDEAHLDERRASVGLRPFSEYKKQMEEVYKPQSR